MNAKTRLLLLGAALLAAALVVLLVLSGRGPEKPLDPLEVLPSRCQAIVVVPDPGRLGDHLALLPRLKLAGLVATLFGFDSADQVFADLSRQAGWDPRSRESMRTAGLDVRPTVGYLSEQGVALLAVAESEPSRLDKLLSDHAANRLGARRRAEKKVGARTIVSFSPEGAGGPSIGWAHVGGYAFLVQGAPGVALLEAVLAGRTEGPIASDPRFAAARARLGGQDFYAFSCADALPPQKRVFVPHGTLLAASLTEQVFSASFELPLNDAWAEKLKSLSTPAGADLVSKLDPDAFLYARLGGDPLLAEPLIDLLVPAPLVRAFQEGGVDLKRDVAGNLKPGVALSLRLAPTAKMGGVPELDVRRTNPFDYVYLNLLGRPADAGKAGRTLQGVVEAAPRFGARLEPRELAGTKAWVTTYQLGEGASLCLKDDFALVTGGAGQMEAQLARLSASGPPAVADAGARRSLQEDGLSLWLDVGRLTSGVRALPDSAYGIGGFAIKAAVSRWLDAIDEIGALRLSGRLEGRSLRAELALGLKLPPAPPPTGAR